MKSVITNNKEDLFSKEVQFLYQKMLLSKNNKKYDKFGINSFLDTFILSELSRHINTELSIHISSFLFQEEKVNNYSEYELDFLNDFAKHFIWYSDNFLLEKKNQNTYLKLIYYCFDNINKYLFNTYIPREFVIFYLPKKNKFVYYTLYENNPFGISSALELFETDYCIYIYRFNQENIEDIKNIYINSLKSIFESNKDVYVYSYQNNESQYYTVIDEDFVFQKEFIKYLSQHFLSNSLIVNNSFLDGTDKYLGFKPISLSAKEKSKDLFYKHCKKNKGLFSWKNRKSFQKDLWNYYIDNYPNRFHRFLLKLRNLFY